MNKGFVTPLILSTLLLFVTSCCAPSAAGYNAYSSFPATTTETHTKTTIVTPPSYPVVNMPPPSIAQAAPIVQQPMMMSAPTYAPSYQAPMACPPAASSQACYQTSSVDPCNPQYTIAVPPPKQPTYTIAIPPAPAPTYQIAIPSQPTPTYNIQTPPSSSFKSSQCESITSDCGPC